MPHHQQKREREMSDENLCRWARRKTPTCSINIFRTFAPRALPTEHYAFSFNFLFSGKYSVEINKAWNTVSAATGRELKIKGDYRGVGARVLYLQILKVVGSLNARHVGRGRKKNWNTCRRQVKSTRKFRFIIGTMAAIGNRCRGKGEQLPNLKIM